MSERHATVSGVASGIFAGRTLRRAGLAGAVATGALLAATGFQGVASVDHTLEAATPGKNAGFQADGGRDCPKKHRRERRSGGV